MNISQQLTAAEQAHKSGQLDIAQKKYEAILKLANHTDALFGLGTLLMQKKLFSQAIPLFKKASEQEPNAADIAYNFALCLFNNNQHQQSLNIIEKSISSATNDIAIAIAFAQLALNLKAPQVSIQLLKNSASLSDQGKNILATAYMKIESWLDAKALWSQLSENHPDVGVLYYNISICATKLALNELAVSSFERYVSIEPSARNFIKFADLYLIMHDCSNARIQLNKAIELKDISVERYEVECKICRLENDKAGTKRAAENVIKNKPDSHIAWQALQELNEPELNQTCIDKLTNILINPLEPSFETQQNLFTLAKALEKKSLFKQAFTQFKQANDLQYRRFCQNGNQYQPETIEQQYRHLREVNYPTINKGQKPKNIFVVGMPRSGTTLINRLLSQPEYAKSCNESNAAAITFEHELFDSELSKDKLALMLVEKREAYYQKYQSSVGFDADLVVDKMPHNFRFVGAILSTFPDAKIVQMRRDPQDLALSIYSHQFHEYHNYACQLSTIAHAIAQANKLMDYWRKTFPEQVIDVDYQAFARDPAKLGKELFNFCKLNWHDQYLNFYKTAVPSYTFSEVQVRKPINTSKIGFSKNYHHEFSEFRQAYDNYNSVAK